MHLDVTIHGMLHWTKNRSSCTCPACLTRKMVTAWAWPQFLVDFLALKTEPKKPASRFDELMRKVAALPPSKPKKNAKRKKWRNCCSPFMGEKLFIYSWFFGGFVIAFIGLFIATILAIFSKPSRLLRVFCIVVAFCGLIYEGGCFATASSFGRATGGGGVNETLNNFLGGAAIIAIIWSVVIISFSSSDADGDESNKGPKWWFLALTFVKCIIPDLTVH